MRKLLSYCLSFSDLEIKRDILKNYLAYHSKANIFQTPEMYEVYKNTKNYEPIYIVVEDENEKIVASLLAVIQKEHSGLLGAFSARSIIWGGPLIKDDDPQILDFILKEFNKIVKKKAIYTQFRNMWEYSEKQKQIFAKHGFIYEDHLDIIHDLKIQPDDQLMKMSKGRRKNIRRADKYGIEFEEIHSKNNLSRSIEIMKSLYDYKNLPFPDDSLFYNALKLLEPKCLVKFFVAKYDNKIIGSRFVLCYKDLIYDWYAAGEPDYLDKYPNDFLPWKVMEWGYENGYETFDFGGAGKPDEEYGVRDYKLKFGGELIEYGRFIYKHKKILFMLGKIAIKIKKAIKL